MPPVQVYSHAIPSIHNVNPNLPAIFAQVDLNRHIAANSALNHDGGNPHFEYARLLDGQVSMTNHLYCS